MKEIGNKIYKLRKLKGLSQDALADMVGVSRQTIYNWETDSVQPNAENIALLCAVLDVDKMYFYDEIENSTSNEEVCNEAIPKSKHNVKAQTFLLVLTNILTLIISAITIIIGIIAFTSNKGDLSGNTSGIIPGRFYVLLAITVALIVIDLLFVIYTAKKNSNK